MSDVVTELISVLPVWKKTDVLVVGGGVTGIVTAVAASRNGARTVLIEQSGVLGGMAAVGLPFLAFFSAGGMRLCGGIPEEIISRMTLLGGCPGHTTHRDGKRNSLGSVTFFDPEVFRRVVLEILTESGVEICLHTWFSMPWMDMVSVKGAFVETKSGRMAISALVTADCTGDGDVAVRSGALMVKGDGTTGQLQSSTMLFVIDNVDIEALARAGSEDPGLYRVHEELGFAEGADGPELRCAPIITGLEPLMVPMHAKDELGFPQPYLIVSEMPRKGQYLVNMAKVDDLDATDADSYSRGEVLGQLRVAKVIEFLHRHVPGFKNARLVRTACQIGIRESRHLLGEHVLTVDEMIAREEYPDTIAMGGHHVDIHRREEKVIAAKRKIPKMVIFPDGYFIPYRCLLPRKIEGLLVAGRCMSSTQAANGSVRVMGTCMAMGQAAGTAAALAVGQRVLPRQVKALELRKLLKEQGAIINC